MDNRNRESGLTLLEVTVCAAILAIIVMLAYPTLSTGAAVYTSESASSDLERQAQLIVDEVADNLALASKDNVYPDYQDDYEHYGSCWVVWQKNEGFADGAIQWGEYQAFHYQYSPDDMPDGVDNDGDGLVDECMLYHWRDLCTDYDQNMTLTHNVAEYLEGEIPNGKDDNGNGLIDERGFCVSRSGNVWTVRLTLTKVCGNGTTVVRTAETSVRPRN
jgi:prepilin-type N-terminal cleavage/methylation domain-containing protein